MESVAEDTSTEDPKLLPRERYVATNRFEVRKGKEAAFEKRWATRKSRLATLPGFKYFHLMRRVPLDAAAAADTDAEDKYNYVSFTIWEDKKAFNAWRSGDAFKEAHGGTSVAAFLGALVSSLKVLRGAPKPAFYDGLLLQATKPETVPETVDGWRQVAADGVSLLPTEAFVACNQFYVAGGDDCAAFEKRWAARESQLSACDGFQTFSMLRRDVKAKGHGVAPLADGEANYQSTTIWRDRGAFEAWRRGGAFKAAHGAPAPAPASSSGPAPASGGSGKPTWSRPPRPVFYEATLCIASPEGA